MQKTADGIRWHPHVLVEKYSPDQVTYATALLGHDPDSTELHALFAVPEMGTAEGRGNILVTAGLNLITDLIVGGTTAGSFKAGQAILGVGTGTTTPVAGNTALTEDGTAGAWYQATDSGPTQSGGVITAVATVAAGDASFAWAEWCAATTTAGAITAGDTLSGVSSGTEVMLNHAVQALGTKGSGASWVLTATITLS